MGLELDFKVFLPKPKTTVALEVLYITALVPIHMFPSPPFFGGGGYILITYKRLHLMVKRYLDTPLGTTSMVS